MPCIISETVLSDLFSDQILYVAVVRAADGELWTRSQMLYFVAHLDLLMTEVTLRRTVGTVVGQVLVQIPAFKLGSASTAASDWVELALLCVILACTPPLQTFIVHTQSAKLKSSND